jgi:PBP1b-binding outer membrane lipoprotein LpoB
MEEYEIKHKICSVDSMLKEIDFQEIDLHAVTVDYIVNEMHISHIDKDKMLNEIIKDKLAFKLARFIIVNNLALFTKIENDMGNGSTLYKVRALLSTDKNVKNHKSIFP